VYLDEKHIASRNRASFNKFTGSSPVLTNFGLVSALAHNE